MEQFHTLSGFLKFKGPDDASLQEIIDASDASIVISNNLMETNGLFQREAIDKTLGMLDITGAINRYLQTGKLYNLAKDGASGELHIALIGTGNSTGYNYEFILNISFDNSTLGNEDQLTENLPWKTYGENRFILRRTSPAA
jgi:hypothetical protein